MKEKQLLEIFSAGCVICQEAIKVITKKYGQTYEIKILDMHNADVAAHAKGLGITTVPSVVIDGKIADCCAGRGIDLAALPNIELPHINTDDQGCCCK